MKKQILPVSKLDAWQDKGIIISAGWRVKAINYYQIIKFDRFSFTQLFFQNKKDLAMKLWGMIENMVMEVSELFNLGINKKIQLCYNR